jgi:hypothetical protein
VAGIVAAALLSIPACSTDDGPVADELLVFAEEHLEAPILVPLGIELGSTTLGTVASSDDGQIIALEVWIQLPGESLAQAQRYCLVGVDVDEPPIPDCAGVIFEGDGVRVRGNPIGDQMMLSDAEWVRP